jgi:hypothetical protein
MIIPPFLVGAALVFWGWQTDNLVAGAVLAIALEAPRRMTLRFDLGAPEHSRIADLGTIGFVGIAVLLAFDRGVARGVLAAFAWLPLALAPVLAAQMLSASGRIPLSALFRYLRKLKQRDPAVNDPLVDVSAVYLAATLLAAGISGGTGPAYYAGVVLAAAWELFAARPRHSSALAFAALLGAAAALGHVVHQAQAHVQLLVGNWITDWHLRGLDADPYRSATDIGALGRQKQIDTIVMRVHAPRDGAARLRLLHRASYNAYFGTSWHARGAPMQALQSGEGGATWTLAPQEPQWRARIVTRLERGRILLPLPAGATRIEGFPASVVRHNALGSVHAELGGDWIEYQAGAVEGIAAGYSAPGGGDLVIPPSERATFEWAADKLGLRGLAAEEAARRVIAHFAGFSYSIFRDRPPPRGETPLGDFMLRTRAGHCEYFAAATTLLLRAAGVPARYATGFAVMEYSALEGAFVVRARHAHAWTRAWLDGRWVEIDTTPPSWFDEEEKLAPAWQGLADLLRWGAYRWSQREEFKPGDAWYFVLAALGAVLAWRLLRGRRVMPKGAASQAGATRRQGEDSEFYVVERTLAPREPGESQVAWLARIAPGLEPARAARLRDALELHLRYRFDPAGLPPPERERLAGLCRALVAGAGAVA